MADLIARYGGGGRSRPDGEEGGDPVSSKIGEIGAAVISVLVVLLIVLVLAKAVIWVAML